MGGTDFDPDQEYCAHCAAKNVPAKIEMDFFQDDYGKEYVRKTCTVCKEEEDSPVEYEDDSI